LGFVTEPYLDLNEAHLIVTAALNEMAGWAVQLRALPGTRSTWNPAATLPIIATFEPSQFNTLLRQGCRPRSRPTGSRSSRNAGSLDQARRKAAALLTGRT
jgi:hypothetical protein